ncbi:MAG: toll/interleukin-1 receptor domain-containing protein [Vicinamibacterales bacterium]
MPAVFLSYRRSDSSDVAEKLRQAFQQRVGARWSFQDVADIEAGTDWNDSIQKNLRTARVVLVLIGPTWLTAMRERLERGEADVLQQEIVTALARKGRRVVPVLIHGVTLPAKAALPPELQPLLKRQAFALRDETWDADVNRLINSIGRPYSWVRVAIRAVVAFFAGAALVWKVVPMVADDRTSDYPFLRGLVLSIAGTYLVVELSIAALYLARQRR